MIHRAQAFLSTLSHVWIGALSLLLVAVVGVLDLLTGYELSFSIFYLLPVALGSWYLSQRFGIFVCGVSSVTWLIVDVSSGHEYSHPSIPLWNMGVRVGFFVIVALLLRRMQSALDVQESLAQLDGLTGLLNARAFKERCASLFALASRTGRPLALAYVDLDGFKNVNDTLGHSFGDQVLRTIGAALAKRLRSSDLGARLGGDEFAVLLPETDASGAQLFFASLHERLLEVCAVHDWPVGFSVGVAVFQDFGGSVDEAIHSADEVMYRIKHSGKNRVLLEVFGESPRLA